ncbi:NtaA/DmoA family FMN-dependent monooxygenase [Herbiconiux ginsengi]|uniref:FMN-dependent oxidoreductase, nitrilotriacetate monooxygenase family n=1 Tax=Herbiconiux ginsengi TaxID=381665 RepID=A0A1H3RY18_9MICO|nr:NtaA/DmoA family FMN-dependent monooxygenase [Herbiconiux ginsengi]SDZ30564.1 FMN-dependent oxidoreductase, nitrilotriacetate monooxygenase family [Herbiconiux ginsengi]
MSTSELRQVHLAAHFPGVNNTTVWSDPSSESQIAFSSFRHFAQNAERGYFDYLFLAEGLRVREHKGRIYEADVAGRPNTLAILAAVAAVTEHIGLVGTLSATFNEPYELARQLATADHLSGGRIGWNVVTTSDAFHGANFRRGAFLDRDDRYRRAAEFLEVSRQLWDGWAPDAVVADKAGGRFLSPAGVTEVDFHGDFFDVTGRATVSRSPQGHPLIVQAGDSAAGRDFAAQHADVIFSLHSEFADAQAFYTDVKSRLPALGRDEDSLKVLPAVTFALGDTQAEAEERARDIALAQTSGATAIAFLERIWGRDLTAYDPDGPLPSIDPDPAGAGITQGRANNAADPQSTADAWRARAEAEKLSIRELVIALSARHGFVGTPSRVAEEINRFVQERASDGFVIVGHTNPYGLDEFVDTVVPELQNRGVYRTSYENGETLRHRLGVREYA